MICISTAKNESMKCTSISILMNADIMEQSIEEKKSIENTKRERRMKNWLKIICLFFGDPLRFRFRLLSSHPRFQGLRPHHWALRADASALSKLNSWRLLKLIKIKSARSRLYRSRFLQVNTRWKALAEIYTMHSFAPLSNLKISVKNRWIVCCFFFPKFRKFAQIWPNFAEFSPNFTIFFRDFSKMQHFS